VPLLASCLTGNRNPAAGRSQPTSRNPSPPRPEWRLFPYGSLASLHFALRFKSAFRPIMTVVLTVLRFVLPHEWVAT
jgi:hypothetical protein